jgi:hypothetical protein
MSYPIVAYQVFQSLDHISALPPDPMDRQYGEAEDYDAFIYVPNLLNDLDWAGMEGIIPYPGSEPIDFVGFLDRLPNQTDFLRTNRMEPIISKRMLYVLRSLQEFPHKAIATRIYDFGFQNQGSDMFCEKAPSLAGNFSESYVGLQLLERIDGIDYEHSEFIPYPESPESDLILPPYISNLVLKEPINGFPPIFRLSRAGENVLLFVSATAKEALEEAGIKGLSFFEYEGTRAEEVGV